MEYRLPHLLDDIFFGEEFNSPLIRINGTAVYTYFDDEQTSLESLCANDY